MGDIEEPSSIPRRIVLSDDTLVLNRHIKAGELDQLSTVVFVPRVQWSYCQRSIHEIAFKFGPCLVIEVQKCSPFSIFF
jgi:hypothetical protein